MPLNHRYLIKARLVFLCGVSLVFTPPAQAVRLTQHILFTDGDKLAKVSQYWGQPYAKGRSEETCAKVVVLKQSYCSTGRWVWYQDEKYHLFQVVGTTVIKHDWTRFKSRIWDEF